MGDLSEHFNRSEFTCQCHCGFDTVDIALIKVLEQVRHKFMAPITITSGCRCIDHNAKIGGSYDSQHTKGRAADFKVKNRTPEEVYAFIDGLYPNRYGLGLYSRSDDTGRVHFDSREGKARWEG